MSLAQFQDTLKTLWMSPEGAAALESEEAFRAFVTRSVLAPEEQAVLERQSLERLRQYQYMLQANVKGTLQAIYPFVLKIMGSRQDELLARYFWQSASTSYRIMAVGEAFPDFLASEAQWLERCPFLAELALYEWVEAELLSAPNPQYPKALEPIVPGAVEDCGALVPVLNKTAAFLQFSYPVPAIAESLKDQDVLALDPSLRHPKPVSVWIYRMNGPYVCRFFELNPLLAAWLCMVREADEQDTQLTYRASAELLLVELRQANPSIGSDYFYREFLGILQQLLDKGILLGSCPA
jgi:hypothetical protein